MPEASTAAAFVGSKPARVLGLGAQRWLDVQGGLQEGRARQFPLTHSNPEGQAGEHAAPARLMQVPVLVVDVAAPVCALTLADAHT
jgi:hypothetical protein